MRRVVLALVVLFPLPASATAEAQFSPCGPGYDAARISCEEAAPAAAAVRGGGEPVAALSAAGWTPIAARPRAGGGEVMAVRGRAALRVRHPGAVADVLAVTAGRELLLSGRRLVGGRPIPADAAVCTTAFAVRVAGLTRALSAGHCAADERTGRLERRFTAVRRPPQPGVPLGTVRALMYGRTPLDVLLLRVPSEAGRGTAPVVWRGSARPPWVVAGTARPLPGRRACFTGRTSGVDRCGRIAGRAGAAAARLLRRIAGLRVVCTTTRAREGDSGGPVYTAPRAGGTVRALGTATLVVGRRSRLCFTPIAPVLDAFDARLVVG